MPDGQTEFKCCPPIREAANREALWDALADGVIDCVVSDHSPCTADLKRLDTGDFGAAWGGDRLAAARPARWCGPAARARGRRRWRRSCGWMSAGPAALAGLTGKGAIAVGGDADLVVFAPDEPFVVDAGGSCTTATRSRRTPGASLRAWSAHRAGCAGGRRRPADGTVRGEPARASAEKGVHRDRLHRSCPTWPRARWPACGGRQRRVLRRAGEPDQARARRRRVHEFGHKGKEYDGWETRRRREPGRRLGDRAARRARRRHGVVVDTAYFTGNYPPFVSVEAAVGRGLPLCRPSCADRTGRRCCERSPLAGDTANAFAVEQRPRRWTQSG